MQHADRTSHVPSHNSSINTLCAQHDSNNAGSHMVKIILVSFPTIDHPISWIVRSPSSGTFFPFAGPQEFIHLFKKKPRDLLIHSKFGTFKGGYIFLASRSIRSSPEPYCIRIGPWRVSLFPTLR